MVTELMSGHRVLTEDGIELGEVKRVDDAAFLIDARNEPDYWLRKADVRSITAEAVRMAFSQDDLQEHAIRYGDLGMQ